MKGNIETLTNEMSDQMRMFIEDQTGPTCEMLPTKKIFSRIGLAPLNLNLKDSSSTEFVDLELYRWALSYSEYNKLNKPKVNEDCTIDASNIFATSGGTQQIHADISILKLIDGKCVPVDMSNIEMIWRDRGQFFFRDVTQTTALRISQAGQLFYLFQAGVLPEEKAHYLLDGFQIPLQSIIQVGEGEFKTIRTCELSFLKREKWLGYISNKDIDPPDAAEKFIIVLIEDNKQGD